MFDLLIHQKSLKKKRANHSKKKKKKKKVNPTKKKLHSNKSILVISQNDLHETKIKGDNRFTNFV